MYFSSYSLVYSKHVPMTIRSMYTFQKFPAQFWVYQLTGISYVKIRNYIECNCAKRGLEKQDFCHKNSQLRCVIVTKHILSVLYMHFTSYFYMVIIHLYVVIPMLEEIYAISGMMFRLETIHGEGKFAQ